MLSEARARVGHRLAMHLHVDRFRLRNATPMVSFTFDDLPKSAVTTGADLLEAHGAHSGSVDLQFLRAMPLIDRDMDPDGIERAFDAAQENNGWLIFYGHDVTERPSPYGCSPALVNHALEAAARRKIPALTMAEA